VKIAVIDQTGNEAGGAQISLELFLRNLPADIEASAIFFETGVFSERIGRLNIPVRVVSLDAGLRSATRERLSIANARLLPGALRPLVSALREIRPDVVYTNGAKAHVLGSIAARLSRVPSVVHHRDILAGPTRLGLLGVLAACSQARIANSAAVARCYPLPNTSVIDNPVDLARYERLPPRDAARAKLGIDGDEPVAGIVGRVNRWKGIDRFLRAIAAVNRRTRLRGVIVGAPHFRDAEHLGELRSLSTELGLDGIVTFVDWVDDTRTVYAAIDINVNASHREPFGRTIIEAAAAGVPSVCFDDAGVSETMIDATMGLVVRAGDEAALTNALGAYAEDPDRRAAAGLAARSWSGRFDAGLHARRVADVLRAAAGAGQSKRMRRGDGRGMTVHVETRS
jgi:glycosyltransferase involved in cell wall biosynthesis